MDMIGSYKIIEALAETKELLICRAEQPGETQTCLIKLLKSEHAAQQEIARLKQEYNIIKSIDLDGVIKTYGLMQSNAGYALILEDFKGIALKKWLRNSSLPDILLFLQIAIKLAEILGYLHEKNIVHKDIKPANILINPETQQLKITNFALSAQLTGEDRDIYKHGIIEGTLAYMSPEQTGRMNRPVDYRTDLYSLGITFYEMLNSTITSNIKKMGEQKYVTMTAFAINNNGRFTFAGMHLVLLIYRAKAGSVERVETNGMWIGILEDINGLNSDNVYCQSSGFPHPELQIK